MLDTPEITDSAIRQNMLARVEAYRSAKNMKLSTISKAAVNDDKFLGRVQNGANFTVKTYQKVMDWLDAQQVAS